MTFRQLPDRAPESMKPSRIAENFDVVGFGLDTFDLAAIAKLGPDRGRIGPDPMHANEAFYCDAPMWLLARKAESPENNLNSV